MQRRYRSIGHTALLLAPLLSSTGAVRADTEANYQCQDGSTFVATFSSEEGAPGTADLKFSDGREIALPQARSADGGRYVGDNVEFWIKGDDATLSIGGNATTCSTTE